MPKYSMNWTIAGLALALLGFALLASGTQAQGPTTIAPGGGAIPVKYDSAANTNSTLVKAGGASLYGLQTVNTTTTLYYLKFYDKATAPTCNSDTVKKKIPVPFGTSNSGGGAVIPMPGGVSFLLGLGWCLTGGIADSDNASAATGVVINLDYR